MRLGPLIAAAILLLVGASSAGSAPIKGATYYSYTAEAYYVFLYPTAQCPGFPGLSVTPIEGRQDLHATIKGWHGPPTYDSSGLMPISEPIRANAHVYGSATDTAGHTYTVNGNFSDNSIHSMLWAGVPSTGYFHGTGSAVLTGPSGTVEGEAEFGYISDNPVSFGLLFTDVHACHMK